MFIGVASYGARVHPPSWIIDLQQYLFFFIYFGTAQSDNQLCTVIFTNLLQSMTAAAVVAIAEDLVTMCFLSF